MKSGNGGCSYESYEDGAGQGKSEHYSSYEDGAGKGKSAGRKNWSREDAGGTDTKMSSRKSEVRRRKEE